MEKVKMKKCKYGRCTVNTKSSKVCGDFKKAMGLRICGLAISEEQYQKLGNVRKNNV
jgi:hypothetical protein